MNGDSDAGFYVWLGIIGLCEAFAIGLAIYTEVEQWVKHRKANATKQ